MKNKIKIGTGLTALCLALLMTVSLLSGCSVFEYVFGGETTSAEGTVTPGPSDSGTGTPSSSSAETGGDITSVPADTTDRITETFVSETSSGPVVTYPDPLTGLPVTKDYSKVRPVAIAIDNLSSAAPQSGISRADILIECMVESGISRLIMITNKYEGNEVYGPVRSVRDYMVSLSQAFGTLFVGAGYSPTGYSSITENKIEYIDGVHDRYAMSGFFRDPVRYENSGYEHSLMITGQGIKALAAHNGFSLADNVAEKFSFSNNVVLAGGDATHAVLTYSSYQQVQLIYSKKENAYYRYQYGTKAHIDAESGYQLSFTNVFILFADQEKIEGDTEGRLSVGVVGSGTGYYLTGGKYIPITWKRDTFTSSFVFSSDSGSFKVAAGKTFITVVDSKLKDTSAINLNYKLS
ncbi:MAG: DUF3048 domain-containing protein [Clostridia bacterium]|nr:DUF3048 domain-containing protein [Clostridia bacterium]